MECFKTGNNRQYYSIAYKRYRNEILKENLTGYLTAHWFLSFCWCSGIRSAKRNGKRGGRLMFKKKVSMHFIHWGIRPTVSMRSGTAQGKRGTLDPVRLFVCSLLFCKQAVCGLCGQQCKSDGDQQSRGDLCGISSVLSVLCRKLVDHLPDGR